MTSLDAMTQRIADLEQQVANLKGANFVKSSAPDVAGLPAQTLPLESGIPIVLHASTGPSEDGTPNWKPLRCSAGGALRAVTQ